MTIHLLLRFLKQRNKNQKVAVVIPGRRAGKMGGSQFEARLGKSS
jgi:hypothetical protein